jgi:hypothetical protein
MLNKKNSKHNSLHFPNISFALFEGRESENKFSHRGIYLTILQIKKINAQISVLQQTERALYFQMKPPNSLLT